MARSGRFTEIRDLFAPQLRPLVPVEALEAAWAAEIAKSGPDASAGEPLSEAAGPGGVVVKILVTGEWGKFTLVASVSDEGWISGLQLAPADAAQPTQPWEPPAYADPESFAEQEMTVGAQTKWPLPGTLSLPTGEGPVPAVVLAHGSGSLDRDETVGPNKVFRDLAWGLASQGIAVLRYDKRSFVYPEEVKAHSSALTVQQTSIDDALAAVTLLRNLRHVQSQSIYVLGHSLGGMVAPRIGKQVPDLAGLVILAGNTRPLEDVILDQLRYLASLSGAPPAIQEAQLKEPEAQVARVKSPSLSRATPAEDLPLGLPASFWLDLRAYQPAEVARSLSMRVLILHGARDYQVTMDDYDGWQLALFGRSNAKLILYPDLNHEFIAGTGKATPAEYAQPGHVDARVITDIANWISGRDVSGR